MNAGSEDKIEGLTNGPSHVGDGETEEGDEMMCGEKHPLGLPATTSPRQLLLQDDPLEVGLGAARTRGGGGGVGRTY